MNSRYDLNLSLPQPVVSKGEFEFAAAFHEHPHLIGQCKGLIEAGAVLKYVYEPDDAKAAPLLALDERIQRVDTFDRIIDDRSVQLVAAAAIPSKRAEIGNEVMLAGKDYFTDKCALTSLEQLESVRNVQAETQQHYFVYYSERVHNESAEYLSEIVKRGLLGEVVHISITGPHKLGVTPRPSWFYSKDKTGGILTDICSHQAEQFLQYSDCLKGEVLHARVDNLGHREFAEFEDFGEAVFRLENGVSCHSRVDWFTPNGLPAFGDGRTFLVGTQGTAELRKYIDIARNPEGDRLFIADSEGEYEIDCRGKIGFPFYGRLINDCIQRTNTAMPQEQAFMAAELSLKAQAFADQRRGSIVEGH